MTTQVRDEPENDRYVAEVDGTVAGSAVYQVRGGRYLFVHTEVDDAFEGQGVGSALVSGALDDVRSKGAPVVPICPFVASYIERHDEYADLVDTEIVEMLDRPSQASVAR